MLLDVRKKIYWLENKETWSVGHGRHWYHRTIIYRRKWMAGQEILVSCLDRL